MRRFGVVAVLMGVTVALLPAAPAHAATWTVVTTPNATNQRNLFNGVDALATNDVWAVGFADHPTAPWTRPLIARYNGTSWSVVSNPALSGSAFLNGVDGSGASNVWAVGAGDAGALAERWNGTSWSVVSVPVPAGGTSTSLHGVKAFSATDAWAVGSTGYSTAPNRRTTAMHWDGTAWSAVSSPNPNGTQNLLFDVDGVATNDLWAIGGLGHDGYGGDPVAPLALRWNGTAWSQASLPSPGSGFSIVKVDDVVAIASNDVWIVGSAFSLTLFQEVPYYFHWTGSGWQQGAMSVGGRFFGVAALSSSQVYAVGSSLVARWTGSAFVQESITVPGGLSDASGVAGTGHVWAVGYTWDPGLSQLRTLGVRTTNG